MRGNGEIAHNPHGGKNDRSVFDVQDELFETGLTLTNSIDIGSSDEKGSIYASVSDLAQQGIIKDNSNYRRTTGRINYVRNLGKILTVTANAGFTRTKSDRIQQGSNLNGLFLGGLRNPADISMLDYVGTYVAPDGSESPNRQRAFRNPLGINNNSIYDNPLWMMNNINSLTLVNRLFGKLEAEIEPTDWLILTARYGLDYYTDDREDIFPELSAGDNNGGRFTKQNFNRVQHNLDLIARGNFKLTDFLNMNALMGMGLNERRFDTQFATIRAFTNPLSPPQLDNSTPDTRVIDNSEEVVRILGYYANVGFDLYDQLFVNFSGRVDGWSSFSRQSDRFFFYPAADLAWQFNKIMPENNILSFGKLRFGYGQVGRGPDAYLTRTDFVAAAFDDGGWGGALNTAAYGGGFARSSLAGNPNIKPEIKTEYELGLDLRFWNDRISFSTTVYTNETKDLIINIDQAAASGYTSIVDNAATIQNKGIEIEASADVLRMGDFSWNIYGNFSRNINEVVDMADVQNIFLTGFTDGSSQAVLGEQLGVLWGSRWDRNDNGSLILDENGFPTIAGAAGVIGDPNPEFRAGAGTVLRYKGFTLDVLFDMAMGGDIWNGTRGALAFFGTAASTGNTTNLTADQAQSLRLYNGATVADNYGPTFRNSDGSYTIRGQIADFGGGQVLLDEVWHRIGPGSGFTGPSEQFVEDGSWARLRELSLSYTFNSEGFRSLTKLQNLSLTFTGRNLKLWTDYQGIDPDTNLTGSGTGFNGIGLDYFQNPATRSYIFTLRVTY
ncbi:MAG: TonB-dependent receptor [Bacteroidia bacterium]|nr:TonB-dependent receptor [Bacteroidia bacterium]